MSIFKSSNPTLSQKSFSKDLLESSVFDTAERMTVKGTINKFGILFLLTLASAYITWKEFLGGGEIQTYIIGGAIGGLVISLVLAFKKNLAPYLAPAFAIAEGLFLGGLSALFEFATGSSYQGTATTYGNGYSGIVVQAIGLTFCVVAAMYLLYKFQVIRVTAKFKAVLVTATVGLGLFYLGLFVASFFNVGLPGFMYQGSWFGIGFSVFVVALAALNLVMDFDMIEQGAEQGAPKYMEWYGAFGLLVTIVWLYIEILRLLAKLNSRD
jgi:uncharacterized YccA/Bax inhibitor family protein